MSNLITLNNLFKQSLINILDKFDFPESFNQDNIDLGLERPKDKNNGDFACTLALRLAKAIKKNPREIAQAIIDNLPDNKIISKVEIAGPGFINVYLNSLSLCEVINIIREKKLNYGCDCCLDVVDNNNLNINLEYVSANPTGPMHVGHGRWAALGDSIFRILKHVGINVYQEFYVNDHGVQMTLFAKSINVRYLQELGHDVPLPDDLYGGEYVKDLANNIIHKLRRN